MNDLLKLTSDFVFKAVFGREEEKACKILLMDFLNDILELEGDKTITEIQYMNPFNLKAFEVDKLSVLDIKVKTGTGERLNIEMQVNDTRHYRKRSLYYWSRLYGETISEAEKYSELKKSIMINIMDCSIIYESDKYHTIFNVMEQEEHFMLVDDLEMHFIDLQKFDDTKDIDEMSAMETWVTLIKDSGNEEKKLIIEKLIRRSDMIGKAVEMLEKISADELLREKYLTLEKARRDKVSELSYAEEKGIEIGRKEVILEIAKRMIARGKSDEEIQEDIGLTIQEIIQLRGELEK
jgi:predicted transposase/invertase (TIGR01784 family)